MGVHGARFAPRVKVEAERCAAHARGASGEDQLMERGAAGPTPNSARVDRDEVFLEYTKSVCPLCWQNLTVSTVVDTSLVPTWVR
jgi:hypothetical protein